MPRSEDRRAGASYLRKLSRAVDTANTGELESTRDALSDGHAEETLELAVLTIERETGATLDPARRAALERLLLHDGKVAIRRLKQEGLSARFPPREEDALEAIVELDGSRPTLAIPEGDAIDPHDEALREWRNAVKNFARQISAVAAAVGRVDLDGTHTGTAFVVKDGLVLTNRHVLQEIASQRADGRWEFLGEATISFDSNPGIARRRHFRIVEVIAAGPDPIDRRSIDYTKLDYAILACDPRGDAPFPSPLPLEGDADKIIEGRPIFTVGYSGQPPSGTYDDDVLARLFQHRYGVKRFAPGEIDRGLGDEAARTGETVFCHDATTLGGNSGSCVVDLGNDGRLVVGLHFAGRPKQANYAHSNARLQASLIALGLNWRNWIQREEQ